MEILCGWHVLLNKFINKIIQNKFNHVVLVNVTFKIFWETYVKSLGINEGN